MTNSLEEAHPDTGTLFSSWLSDEADQANAIKRETPVMVVIGNPPHSGISSNNGEWISKLIDDYKYVDGIHFNERKHWLNDDYVKFIRFAEHLVNKNGEGILAFINPHGFLDNPTFRGMRWHLLRTFDKIYTVDLHGNSTKKEVSPDGSLDVNVFDIMQGVSINLLIKNRKKENNELGKVFRYDLYGKREFKYSFLSENGIKNINFEELDCIKPNYFFAKSNNNLTLDYELGFDVKHLFLKQSMGITTARDHFIIDVNFEALKNRIKEFASIEKDDAFIRNKYFGSNVSGKYLAGDTRGWNLGAARVKIREEDQTKNFRMISYRPFDKRHIYYSKNMVDWGREEVMKNLMLENFSLVFVKIGRDVNAHNYFVSNAITDKSLTSSLDNANVFPLYLYPETTNQISLDDKPQRVPNLNMEIVDKFAKSVGYYFSPEEPDLSDGRTVETMQFYPIDILDYIYAVLHSPAYREKYKEFLKIDFPRVPYPTLKTFMPLAELGKQLRELHLLESEETEKYIIQYPKDGNNEVVKPLFVCHLEHSEGSRVGIPPVLGKVYINDTQYFNNVPEIAWNFYIGGYQPAQKWLKDRKGRVLEFEDILHYQKIIVALKRTSELMVEIDKVIFD